MTDRPIIFSGPMVRAILSGAKTQTRRAIRYFDGKAYATAPARARWQPPRNLEGDPRSWRDKWFAYDTAGGASAFPIYGLRCPYGIAGDRLWVRETWAHSAADRRRAMIYRADEGTARMALQEPEFGHWRPAIHMPRKACRTLLEIMAVRIERLREVTEQDALAEGVKQLGGHHLFKDYLQSTGSEERYLCTNACASYYTLWDLINGDKRGFSWEANPWVWVVEFARIKGGA